jgi:exosortase
MSVLHDQPLSGYSDADSARWWTPAMLIQALALAGLIAALYWHVLDGLVFKWKDNGDWSHGFIIPLFSLYYLYLQRDRMPQGLPSGGLLPRLAGAGLIVGAFFLYLRSTQVMQVYPTTLALVLTIMGAVLMTCGWPTARWSWFAVAFLLFALPLPPTIYERMTLPLRELAAHVSAALLSLLPEMQAEPRGTVVEYLYNGAFGTLDVERACSGMRLLVTMSALGVAMAFVNERPLWQRMIMILACVPIAIFCNIVRVTTTGFLIVLGRQELASGTPHMLLGLGMLLVAFALYGGISYVLSHLFVEAEAPPAQGVAVGASQT